MKGKILLLIIGLIILICIVSGYLFLKEKSPKQTLQELKLSDFPDVFKGNTIIVVGKNASKIEKECANEIAANLENLTGNKPEIISSEKTESFKYNHNLIIIGTPKTNFFLNEVYQMTNAARVMEEYPGEGKGILEILRNPWNESKTMLLVEGSDEWGVKAGSEMLTNSQKLVGKSMKVPSKVRIIQGVIKQMSMRPLMGMWIIQTSDGERDIC